MTDNFLEALKMVRPVKRQEIFFRLYYDNDGNIITYSMEDLEGDFIEVTCEEFAIGDKNIKIVDGKIHKICLTTYGKLVPINNNPTDITVITDKPSWKMKTYE